MAKAPADVTGKIEDEHGIGFQVDQGECIQILIGQSYYGGFCLGDDGCCTALDVYQLHFAEAVPTGERCDESLLGCLGFRLPYNSNRSIDNEIHAIVVFTLGKQNRTFGVGAFNQIRLHQIELMFGKSSEHAVLAEKLVGNHVFTHTVWYKRCVWYASDTQP